MDFERDEMFRLMSVRLSDWRQMSRSVVTVAGAGMANKAKDNKPVAVAQANKAEVVKKP